MEYTVRLLVSFGLLLFGFQIHCFEIKKRQLLEKGAINEPDLEGITPFIDLFHRRADCMPVDDLLADRFVEHLVKHCGADIKKGDKKGKTALHYALHSCWKYVPILVKCGADVCKDGNGNPFYPLEELFEEVKHRHLSYGKFNVQYEGNWSVHHFRFRKCVELLIQRGCGISFTRANEFWEIGLVLAQRYILFQPLQECIEKGSFSGENLKKIYRASFNVQLHYIPDPDMMHSKQLTTLVPTKATVMIRKSVLSHYNSLKEQRCKRDSYFSLLPLDIIGLLTDYLHDPEYKQFIAEISS